MKTRLLSLGFLIVLSAACAPSPQDEAVQREATRQSVDVASTAQAAPTVAAKQTADVQASASQTAVVATAVAQSTAQAATTLAMATQQSKDVDARVLAAISATQAAIPTATPIPATPIVIVVTQQPAAAPPAPIYVPVPVIAAPPIYVPVLVPAPGGSAPDYVMQAINESNNASAVAKWSLNANDLLGHVVYRELSRTQDNVGWLNQNRTRVKSLFVAGWVTSWNFDSPTRLTAFANETWHFVDYDADSYALKKDLGARLYRNIYTIDYVGVAGWKVSFDDVPNPSGEAV